MRRRARAAWTTSAALAALACVAAGACATGKEAKVDDRPIAERGDLDAAPPSPSALAPIPAEAPPPRVLAPSEAEASKSTAEVLDEVVQEAAEAPAAPSAPPPLTQSPEARQRFEEAVAAAPAAPGRAMALFEQAARSDPKFVAAWYNAGVAAERQGKLNAAVRYYHKALERAPTHQASLFNLVQIYRRLGRPRDAEAVAQRALAQRRDAGSLVAAGAAALVADKVSDAEQFAKQALKEDELNAGAMLVLAEVYFRQGKYELSKFVLTNASAIEPDNALILEGLGRAFLKLDQRPAAKKKFEEAVALRQDLVESYVNLAALYYEVGDYGGAAAASRQAVTLAPKLGAAWLNRGNALRAQRRYDDAIAAYTKASQLEGDAKARAHFNLGILYLDNDLPNVDYVQRMEQAIQHLEAYKARARMSEREAERAEKYLTEAQRLKGREVKKRERAAKRKADEEAKRRAEEEAKRKAEEEARRKAAEEAARKKAAEDALQRKVGDGK